MIRILLLHGPHLSQLGTRDAAQYGTATLEDVVASARAEAEVTGTDLVHEQHESETDLLRRLHAARLDGTAAVVINAGALTHYSHALRDALELLDVPVVELHLSNVHAREDFRRHSYVSPVATAVVAGFGVEGYAAALRFIAATG